MANKTITLSITEDEVILNSAIDSIARGLGWTDTIINEHGEEVSNPETQLEKIRIAIMLYLGDIAKSYNATQAAELARRTALEQTEQAIGNITSTLVIE